MTPSEKLKEIEGIGPLISSSKIAWLISRVKQLEIALKAYSLGENPSLAKKALDGETIDE